MNNKIENEIKINIDKVKLEDEISSSIIKNDKLYYIIVLIITLSLFLIEIL